MKYNLTSEKLKANFVKEINNLADTDINHCYQCGKCSAGCLFAFEMDLLPNQIIQLTRLGADDIVLNSKTIWICASCETCSTRCPREVDIAHIMDALRITARQRRIKPAIRTVPIFHEVFLTCIKNIGRVYEVGLVGALKLTGGSGLFQDIFKAPIMFLKGKLPLLPHIIKNKANLKKIFHRWKK